MRHGRGENRALDLRALSPKVKMPQPEAGQGLARDGERSVSPRAQVFCHDTVVTSGSTCEGGWPSLRPKSFRANGCRGLSGGAHCIPELTVNLVEVLEGGQ